MKNPIAPIAHIALMAGVFVLLTTTSAWAQDTELVATQVDDDEAQVDENADVVQADDSETVETSESDVDEEVVLDDADSVDGSSSLIEPFWVSLGLSTNNSIGALFRDEFSVSNYALLYFNFAAGWSTPVPTLGVSTSIGYSKFLTTAGGSTEQYEGRIGDLGLSANYGSFFRDSAYTGINLGANFSMSFPTSEASRFSNLITRLRGGLTVSRDFGDLSLSYSFGVGKYFHRDTTVVADLDQYAIDVIARDGGSENIGELAIALDTGVLTEWIISNNFSLSYVWVENFSTFISFGFSGYYSYATDSLTVADEFTSDNAVLGRGHAQTMNGSFGASYSFLDYFSAHLTFDTTQAPLTADNSSVRFPFWDLETGNLANTSISFGLDARY